MQVHMILDARNPWNYDRFLLLLKKEEELKKNQPPKSKIAFRQTGSVIVFRFWLLNVQSEI